MIKLLIVGVLEEEFIAVRCPGRVGNNIVVHIVEGKLKKIMSIEQNRFKVLMSHGVDKCTDDFGFEDEREDQQRSMAMPPPISKTMDHQRIEPKKSQAELAMLMGGGNQDDDDIYGQGAAADEEEDQDEEPVVQNYQQMSSAGNGLNHASSTVLRDYDNENGAAKTWNHKSDHDHSLANTLSDHAQGTFVS